MDTVTEFFKQGLNGDQSAREWCQDHFNAALLEWLKHHPERRRVCSIHNEAHLVGEAFQIVWQRPIELQEFDFKTPSSVLRFLFATLNGVMLEATRTMQAASLHSMPTRTSIESAMKNHAETQKLWKAIEDELSNDREIRLAYLLFHCGLKPQDIVSKIPDEFSDVREITHLRLRIMQMLAKKVLLKADSSITP